MKLRRRLRPRLRLRRRLRLRLRLRLRPRLRPFALLLFLAVLTLVSCRSSKNAAKEKADITKTSTTITTNSTTNPPTANNKREKSITPTAPSIEPGTIFTSRVKVTILQNGKDVTTTGMLRMRYDDVIQLTLVDPVLGIAELGRMELSPDSMLVLDRINKRYVSTPYDDFDVFRNKGITFESIQNFFWQEAQRSDALTYTIPAKNDIKLDLKISDKGASTNWNTHTSVSSKYTKTDANKLFSSMIGK